MWSFFIKKPRAAWLVIISILFLGSAALNSIPREIQPDIKVPIASVATALPGASPSDIETLITDELEAAIDRVDNVKKITSSSGFGLSTIIVEFEESADLDEAVDELKDAVDLAKSDLPEDATDPITNKQEANSDSIITFSLVGERPLTEIAKVADEVKEELEKIEGVSEIVLIGKQEKYLQVSIDPVKAQTLGVTPNQIAQTIKGENVNFPIGNINVGQTNYPVRIDNQIKSLEEILEMPIGSDLKVRDVANLKETFTEKTSFSKLAANKEKAGEAISLQVFKKDGSNVIAVSDLSKEKIESLKGNIIPEDVQVETTNDNSEFIRQDLDILTNSGIQTTLIIIVLLFLALGFFEGLLAAFSIPLTLLVTIIILNIQGMTINGLTLFSLVIALGLIVDTAIVIMEGIYENIKEGKTAKEAALASVQTYKWPLIAGTLTSVFAFFPMLLVSGILGEFLKALPITIGAALLSSIVLSLTVIPAVTAQFLKRKEQKDKSSILEPFFAKLGDKFQKLISKILNSTASKVVTILITLALFVASMSLPFSGALKAELFPQTDFRFFFINIKTTDGLELEKTNAIVEEVESVLYEIEEIQNFVSIVGSASSSASTDIVNIRGADSSNRANITINLVPKEERERKSYEVAAEIREKLKDFNKAEVQVNEVSEGPPSEAPIVARIIGTDQEVLKELKTEIEAILENIDGPINIQNDLSGGQKEFVINLDRQKIKRLGLSSAQISGLIRSTITGTEASDIKLNGEDLTILVKYDFPSKNSNAEISLDTIKNLTVQSPTGENISLANLAEVKLANSSSTIRHEDLDRIIKVTADLENDANAVEVQAKAVEETEKLNIPSGYEIKFEGDTADIDQSFQELFQSMFLAVILITFTLVLMFNSFRQPIIIMMTLPLAVIGVFPGLALVGLNLSFPAFLGIVALSGVVVNDAIVLIDQINQNRKNKMDFNEAIEKAANSRLQPIIMTTITTVAGILPLALTNEFWSGLGFSLIFGLIAGTGLTLIIIPILYQLFERKKQRW
jgi:multidrug efflux pump subunit AcrB